MKQAEKKLASYLSTLSVAVAIFVLMSAVSFFEQRLFGVKNMGANATGACPGGYIYIDGGDFCVEEELHDGPGNDMRWDQAAEACVVDDGARLCTAAEWAQVCELDDEGDITIADMPAQEEWVDDFVIDQNHATVMGDSGNCLVSDDQNFGGPTYDFRCCKNGVD
jgi:hypothetical protein